MSYFLSKNLKNNTVDSAITRVTELLKEEGFGIISKINIADTLKKKIDVDFKEYHILGACNPHFAHKALLSEDKIGLLLPCNVVVVDQGDGNIEVSAIDPLASMATVENADLAEFALMVKGSLETVIKKL
jgi:uncharacterized protein (DUF302 family)